MPTLLIAAAGGHLEELWQLRPRLGLVDDDVTWVTSDSPQARSLLAGEQRLFAPPARPRDAAATLATLRFARHVLALDDWTDVVSTGPLIAVPFLTVARARGIRCHYIESPARVTGPSLSARLVERVPGVRCYSPYEWWQRPGWVYRGSVLDGYRPAPGTAGRLRRMVVTVGTSPFDFSRLLRRMAEIVPAGCDVLWQTGHSDVAALGIDARPFVTDGELAAAMTGADLVVSHAGVGSALAAMRCGRAPLLAARRAGHGEHVDDHQTEIATELTRRRLAFASSVDDLSTDSLLAAAGGRVTTAGRPPPFRLEGSRPAHEAPVPHRATA